MKLLSLLALGLFTTSLFASSEVIDRRVYQHIYNKFNCARDVLIIKSAYENSIGSNGGMINGSLDFPSSQAEFHDLTNPTNINYDCSELTLTISRVVATSKRVQDTYLSQLTCKRRTFSEKAALNMAKTCEKQPTEDCFKPEMLNLINSVEDTVVKYDVPSDICKKK